MPVKLINKEVKTHKSKDFCLLEPGDVFTFSWKTEDTPISELEKDEIFIKTDAGFYVDFEGTLFSDEDEETDTQVVLLNLEASVSLLVD